MDEQNIFRLQAEVSGLANTLEERDRYIQKLADDLKELEAKNLLLESQLTELATDAKAAVNKTTLESTAKAASSYLFLESRQEIELLESSLRDTLSAAQVNTLVIAELEEARLKRDLVSAELTRQTTELALAKSQATTAQIESADLRERLLEESIAANTLRRDLDIYKQRVDISFTAAQLSGYMSQAIDSFSREANSSDFSHNYVINEMEVTFKASLTKNDTGEMTLAAPSLSGGDDTLSSIKFSIRAIPKDNKDQ